MISINKKRHTLVLFLLFCAFNVSIAQSEPPGKVLFVGNSYTYFWNLPQNVALMAQAKELDIETTQSTAGGSHWGHHWRGERDLKTMELLHEGNYDAVVLQNHSMSTLERVDSIMYFGQKFAEIIKHKGARIYLYQTWSREWNPYMQETITEVYNQLAEKIHAQVVPVGQAWERAKQLRPDINLYDEDGSHPSSLGTYLTACVFYGVLTGQSPVGLPNRMSTLDAQGQKLFINIQSPQTALFCQKVAEDIINEYID
jgi:hypothetical protein